MVSKSSSLLGGWAGCFRALGAGSVELDAGVSGTSSIGWVASTVTCVFFAGHLRAYRLVCLLIVWLHSSQLVFSVGTAVLAYFLH